VPKRFRIGWLAREYVKRALYGGKENVYEVKVVKVDRRTLKQIKLPFYVPKMTRGSASDEEILDNCRKSVNVGDFVLLPNRKVYRRVRGGWREATDDDLAELITSEL